MKNSLKPTKNKILVDPLYDPDTVETGLSPGAPGLYMPDTGKNPMSQQGVVLAVGPEQKDVEPGDYVLYHPFIGIPIPHGDEELLLVEYRHLVGFLSGTGELWPLPDDVVIAPEFQRAGLQGLLWVPRQVFHIDVPCTGVVLKRGERVIGLEVGQRVLYPPGKGNEIGLRKVFYTIKGADLLATVGVDVKVSITVTPQSWEAPSA